LGTLNQPPFTESDLQAARQRLQDAGFPLTGQAAELQQLGTPEPFQTYTVAASESLRAFQDTDDQRRDVKAARRTADIVDRIAKWTGRTIRTGKGKPLKIACEAGCNYCCSIRVNVLSAEVASILEFIDTHFNDAQRMEILDAVDQFVSIASQLDPKTRFLKPMLCPLNKNGLCTVYDARPMACRSHHSFSVDQCRTSFENWEEDHPVTRSAMRKACSEAAVMALVDVLDFVELDPRSLELPEALQIALQDPKADLDRAYIPAISEAALEPDLFKPR